MSQQEKTTQEKLEFIKNGLFRIGPDRIRALSTHETDDLVEEMDRVLDQVIAELKS